MPEPGCAYFRPDLFEADPPLISPIGTDKGGH
jgi:hypothetical protein